MSFRYKSPIVIDKKYLKRINFHKLKGRLLHLPAPKNKNKTFVVLPGQHSAHERMYAIAQLLNEYGEVYMPDIPGFGGMDSFYKIGKKPTYDNYADYLYSFLKSKKLDKNVVFFANSYSSQFLTRMFDKYPETVGWTKQAIAFVGFGAGVNFHVSFIYKTLLFSVIYPLSTKWGAKLAKWLVFNPISIRIMLFVFSLSKAKMQSDNSNLKKEMIQMEGYLWSIGDKQTHASTAISMFSDDLRKHNKGIIDLKLHNVITDNDQYFDNVSVERTFRELYRDYETSSLNLHVHAPSLIANKEDVRKMLSDETLKLLAK